MKFFAGVSLESYHMIYLGQFLDKSAAVNFQRLQSVLALLAHAI